MPTEHVRCEGCGATVLALNPRCRFCGYQVEAGPEVHTPVPDAAPGLLGIDSLSLMVAVATTAFPVHAWLAGQVAPNAMLDAELFLDQRYAASALCGFVLGALWRPKTTRGLLVVIVFLMHMVAFVQMSSWRVGSLGLDPPLLGLGALVGAVAAVAAILGGLLRGLGVGALQEAEAAP